MSYFPNFNFFSLSLLQMADAGFYHCGNDKEPDYVQCFVCQKELDGWEPNDDPV